MYKRQLCAWGGTLAILQTLHTSISWFVTFVFTERSVKDEINNEHLFTYKTQKNIKETKLRPTTGFIQIGILEKINPNQDITRQEMYVFTTDCQQLSCLHCSLSYPLTKLVDIHCKILA